MRYINLSDSEQKELETLYKTSSNATIRKRSHCLLLSNKGLKTTELMRVFNVTRITIYNWFNDWEKNNLQSLPIKTGQGRKGILKAISQSAIEDLVDRHPQNLNVVLSEIKAKYAVECHKQTLKRHLKNMGLDIQKSSEITQRQTR